MLNANASIIRIRRFFWVGIVALGLLVLLLAATGKQLSSQGNTAREIGVGAPGMGAYQFAGRIDQDGFEFTGYGYLYDVQGLAPNELFADPLNTSETTARFTYYATATLTSRAIVTDPVRGIFALDSVGQITFYYQSTPSASFDDPQSFAEGTPIATASVRFQDILSVQAPNRGIAVGNGEFSVLTAEPFTFGEETVRFGRPGIVYRISTFGDGVRTDPLIPQSSVLLAGNAVDSGFRQTFLPTVANPDAP
jgi:hypothetical protein